MTMTRIAGERVAALLVIIAALYLGYLALEFPAGGHRFPVFVCGMAVLIGLLMLGFTWLKPALYQGTIQFDFSYGELKPIVVAVLAVLYVLAIFRIGYYVSSIAFLLATTWLVGIRNWKAVGLTAIVLFPLMYLFFEAFLQADLPRGLLF